jgi:hypothetical protein
MADRQEEGDRQTWVILPDAQEKLNFANVAAPISNLGQKDNNGFRQQQIAEKSS